MKESTDRGTSGSSLSPCVYVGIPAYNVEDTVIRVLDEIKTLGIVDHVLVVDDGSGDATSQKLSAYDDLRLSLFTHLGNLGYGAAVKTLLREFGRTARNAEDILVIVHGDGQTPPAEITEMVLPFSDSSVDIVLGSRMLAGFRAQYGKRATYKIVCDYVLTFIQNILYGMRLIMYASGYRAFRRRAVDKLDYLSCDDRHSFDTEVLIKAGIASLILKEIPVSTVKGSGVSHNVLFNYAVDSVKLMVKYGFQRRSRSPFTRQTEP